MVATDLDGRPVPCRCPSSSWDRRDRRALRLDPSRLAWSPPTGKPTWPGREPAARQGARRRPEVRMPSRTTRTTRPSRQSVTFGAEVPGPATTTTGPAREPRYLPCYGPQTRRAGTPEDRPDHQGCTGLVYDQDYREVGASTATRARCSSPWDHAKEALGAVQRQHGDPAPGRTGSVPERAVHGSAGRCRGTSRGAAGSSMDLAVWFGDVSDGAKLFGVLSWPTSSRVLGTTSWT